jgi:hypothetical protein
MLYVIHCANHPELQYRGGQGPIVHLEADLHTVVRWAEANRRRWAFSLSNAGAYYTEFSSQSDELHRLDWRAIESTDFRAPAVKESKQAEFLFHGLFPFELVERIGARSQAVANRASQALQQHRPRVEVLPLWYF